MSKKKLLEERTIDPRVVFLKLPQNFVRKHLLYATEGKHSGLPFVMYVTNHFAEDCQDEVVPMLREEFRRELKRIGCPSDSVLVELKKRFCFEFRYARTDEELEILRQSPRLSKWDILK